MTRLRSAVSSSLLCIPYYLCLFCHSNGDIITRAGVKHDVECMANKLAQRERKHPARNLFRRSGHPSETALGLSIPDVRLLVELICPHGNINEKSAHPLHLPHVKTYMHTPNPCYYSDSIKRCHQILAAAILDHHHL